MIRIGSMASDEIYFNNVHDNGRKARMQRSLSSTDEPPRDKPNKVTCAPSEDSDQPEHPSQSDQGLRCPHEESLGP